MTKPCNSNEVNTLIEAKEYTSNIILYRSKLYHWIAMADHWLISFKPCRTTMCTYMPCIVSHSYHIYLRKQGLFPPSPTRQKSLITVWGRGRSNALAIKRAPKCKPVLVTKYLTQQKVDKIWQLHVVMLFSAKCALGSTIHIEKRNSYLWSSYLSLGGISSALVTALRRLKV